MQRRVFSLLCALSLLLFLATVVLWIRSFGGTDDLTRRVSGSGDGATTASHAVSVQVTRGDIRLQMEETTVFSFIRAGATTRSGAEPRRANWSIGRLGPGHVGQDLPEQHQSPLGRLGFYTYRTGAIGSFFNSTMHGVSVPAWFLAILFLLLPVQWVVAVMQARRRRRAGCCPHCGYNLTGNQSGICPECGSTLQHLK